MAHFVNRGTRALNLPEHNLSLFETTALDETGWTIGDQEGPNVRRSAGMPTKRNDSRQPHPPLILSLQSKAKK
ncbi:hypothetical protein V6N12_049092 [Hibiscus sabdariffa]|uniref:Uncharacterized protein n=1 Tax=Hibiscus sabdariffa TaxID=183260 RepID=A0ABR2EKW8_9ROSI